MNTASAGKSPCWVVSSGAVPTIEIILQQQTVVLSWHQFVYAEGDSEQIHVAFASHDVVIKGAGLDSLLPAVAGNCVVSLRESARAERFSGQAARFVSEIVVRRIEGR